MQFNWNFSQFSLHLILYAICVHYCCPTYSRARPAVLVSLNSSSVQTRAEWEQDSVDVTLRRSKQRRKGQGARGHVWALEQRCLSTVKAHLSRPLYWLHSFFSSPGQKGRPSTQCFLWKAGVTVSLTDKDNDRLLFCWAKEHSNKILTL